MIIIALTDKGRYALAQIEKYYPKGQFSAKDLSDACGEKIASATLSGVANNGFITKVSSSPATYETIDGIEELLALLKAEEDKGCDNSNLLLARKTKNDEFYTLYDDIELEVMKYRKQFKDKVVYLPCDDPAEKQSEFWSFFVNNFEAFGLKKLIATHYDENGKAYKIWIDGDIIDGYVDDADAQQEDLEGNGDFRSPECVEILKESDIVCTNPPFSLFRDFIEWLMANDKKFLIIGNQNAFTYKEVFPLIKNNKIWTGYNMVKEFVQPDKSIKKFGNICWFTNMPNGKRNEELVLTKTYNNVEYSYLDNYNAINVDRVVNIPKDFDGYMAVPLTFIYKYNPEQFEVYGFTNSGEENPGIRHEGSAHGRALLNGKEVYTRILIKRKK